MDEQEANAWIAAVSLGEVLARRVGEEESERGAAYRSYDCETASAWKTDPDFSNALIMALEAGELKLLRDYVVSSRPVPQVDAFVAGKSVPMRTLVAQLLGHEQQTHQQKQGRPQRIAHRAPDAEKAERNAAWLAAYQLKAWRECHGSKRTPELEKGRIINDAIEEAAKTFKVKKDAIKEGNVRNLLKSGRVVVR